MNEHRLRIGVVIGSTRSGRFGPVVATWFADLARQREDLDIDVLDVADGPLDGDRLDALDGYVVVTPEYNHSYPGPLKAAVDAHGQPWRAKPVAFVAYGGISGGLRAVEHLRVVFAELHAVTIRETVSFHGASSTFDDEGRPVDPSRPAAAAKALLDQLAWWAWALRTARLAVPYSA
jgi:NAD(P)H-dependent FMN reductase